MWQRIENLLHSVSTYADLSPDLAIRQQVNQVLRDRPALSLDRWYERFWQPLGITKAVVAFVYSQLECYSGLEVARWHPSDRLNEDLKLTLVCWYDWDLSLYDDILDRFGVDVSECFDPYECTTVGDFVVLLHRQLEAGDLRIPVCNSDILRYPRS